MTMGEAAVYILQGKDEWANEACDGPPKWITWGDLSMLHRVRELAGLPQRSYLTPPLVLDALGKYAAKENSPLAVVAYDRQNHGRYFGLAKGAKNADQ